MDKMDPNAGDFEVDLECGMPVIEEDLTIITSPIETVKSQAKSLLAKVSGTFVDHKSGGLTEHLLSSSDVVENGKSVTVKGEASVKKVEKEGCKNTNNKKAAKPPRPPKGPSLDAADQKLIKEIQEMAMLKRVRVERLRALQGNDHRRRVAT